MDRILKLYRDYFYWNYFLTSTFSCQGMDQVKRQTGQHLEFEPEWEGAFNLQLKLEDNIVLFMDWCAGDVSVLWYTVTTG